MKKQPPKKFVVSAADIALFRQTVRDINPLAPTRHQPKASIEAPLLDYWPATVSSEEKLLFAKTGVSQRLLRKLRQGHIPRNATLDLHGQTAAEAQQSLQRFLQTALHHHYRCVHIIHGKSLHQHPNPPVLKNYVNSWLRQHPAIVAFCSALPRDGGNGAVYVLLRAGYLP